MFHVTVCTPMSLLRQEKTVLALLNNSRHLGLTTVVLGHERLWTHYFHFHKILLLDDWLRHVPDDELILFTDSMDVLLMPGSTEVAWREALEREGCPVVFSAEPNCHPEHLKSRYPPSESPFCYLNSGCFIGWAWALRRILDVILDPFQNPFLRFCDQNSYMRFFLEYPGAVRLDTEQRFFLSTIFAEHLDIRPGRIAAKAGLTPLALHFNADRRLLPWWVEPPESDEGRVVKSAALEAGFVPEEGILDDYPVVSSRDYKLQRHGSCRYVVPYVPLPLPLLHRLFSRQVRCRPSESRRLATVLILILFKQWERVRRSQ